MDTQEKLEVLWTVEQVAAYFSLSKRTVYQWIAQERVINVDTLVYIGTRVRIPRSEVERIARQKKKAIVTRPVATKPVQEAVPAIPATPIT